MKPKKMSLATIEGKLTRDEMKKIMAGSGDDDGACNSDCSGDCTFKSGGSGHCRSSQSGTCYCVS